MQLKKKMTTSAFISFGALIASILMPIIPCKTAPNIPNPIYKWTICTLNPDTVPNQGIREYLGYSTSITNTYFLIIILAFALSMLVLHFITKRKD